MMKRFFLLSGCLMLWLGGAPPAPGETVLASTNPERKGSGELSVAVQNYYTRSAGRVGSNVQGAMVSLRHFFPSAGLLTLHLEPVADAGRFTAGENYVRWTGLPWLNRHWDLSAGDFRSATAMVRSPLQNLSQPEVSLRGVHASARTEDWSFSLYGGAETLSQGSRVPHRVRVPQIALGGELVGTLSEKVDLGVRFLRLSSPESRVLDQGVFFPVNRRFVRSDTVTSQLNVHLSEKLEWYTEAGWSRVRGPSSAPSDSQQFSLISGPAFLTQRLSVRANYFNQGTGYLPLLGYYLGDRRGVNLDGIWQVGRFSFSGNFTQARNNRERNPVVPDYRSRQGGAGFQVRLPSNFYLSGSLSHLRLQSRSAETGLANNDNRQVLLSLSRPFYRHNLRATVQRLDTEIRGVGQRIEFLEAEDNYTWRRFSIGGAVRWQRATTDRTRHSLFLRASGQYQTRRLSLYGYWEQGKDLANETLFSTQISSTSVVGISWQAPQGILLRAEAFRNQVNTLLNPESLFVLGNRGLTPDTLLNRAENWSLFLNVSRRLSWGEPWTARNGRMSQPVAPLTGTLAGYVRMETGDGVQGAGDVWLVTDTGHAVKTDSSGFFQVLDMPQGSRKLRLDMDRLPANFDPPQEHEVVVEIRSSQLSRVDLRVTPLVAVEGVVLDEREQPAPEGVVIHLLPVDNYTTTNSAGQFGFYNLLAGDYVLQLSESSLPENARLIGATSQPVQLRYGQPEPRIEFRYQIVAPEPKPARKIFLQGQSEPLPPAATAASAPSGRSRGRILARATSHARPVAPGSTDGSAASPPAVLRWVAR